MFHPRSDSEQKSPLKIFYLIVDKGISPHGTKGASAHVRELSSAMVEIGLDVVVVARNVEGPETISDRIRVIPIGAQDRENALVSAVPDASGELTSLLQNSDVYRALMNLVQKERPDAILERLSLFSFAGLAASKNSRIPYLLEVNAPLSQEAATYRSLILRETAEVLERAALRGANVVLPVSTTLRDWTIAAGVAPQKAELLPNGVDTKRFDPSAAVQIRSKLGFEGTAHVLGFVGGMRPWHGLALMSKAFEIIAARDTAARLLVVGDGPGRENLEDWRRKSGLSDRVVIVGHVSHAEVPDFLATMDVVLVPYEDIPGFYFSPLKVLESMAMGRPIVASSVGDIPGLLLEGRAGLLVQPGCADALASAAERLLSDPKLSSELGKTARECAVNHHDWRHVARKIEDSVRRVKRETEGSR